MHPFNDIERRVADALAGQAELLVGFVFGSAVGNPDGARDVDVAVYAGRALGLEERLDLADRLCLATGRDIDLVDLREAYGLILQQILTKGRLVLKRSSTALAEITLRMLYDQADMEPYRQRIQERQLERFLRG